MAINKIYISMARMTGQMLEPIKRTATLYELKVVTWDDKADLISFYIEQGNSLCLAALSFSDKDRYSFDLRKL